MKNSLTTFYIVRHGQTEANLKKIIQGHLDSPLTKLGKDQAMQTALKLKDVKFDKIFSSDLLRAKRTAEIITLERKLAIETTKLLREQFLGSLEGTDNRKLFALFDEWDSLSKKVRMKVRPSSDSENDEEIVNRFITFIRETAITYPGKNVLVVTHGGMICVLLVKIGYTTYSNLEDIDNAGYIKLLSDGVEFTVKETHGLILKKEK